MYFVYMVKNNFNNLYIGISENPEKRLHDHNNTLGAHFTKNKEEFYIVFLEKYENLSQARVREIQLKKWSRKKKEFLIGKHQKGLKTQSSTT